MPFELDFPSSVSESHEDLAKTTLSNSSKIKNKPTNISKNLSGRRRPTNVQEKVEAKPFGDDSDDSDDLLTSPTVPPNITTPKPVENSNPFGDGEEQDLSDSHPENISVIPATTPKKSTPQKKEKTSFFKKLTPEKKVKPPRPDKKPKTLGQPSPVVTRKESHNPFGDSEEEEEDLGLTQSASINPFGEDSQEDEAGDIQQVASKISHVTVTSNPFGEDSQEDLGENDTGNPFGEESEEEETAGDLQNTTAGSQKLSSKLVRRPSLNPFEEESEEIQPKIKDPTPKSIKRMAPKAPAGITPFDTRSVSDRSRANTKDSENPFGDASESHENQAKNGEQVDLGSETLAAAGDKEANPFGDDSEEENTANSNDPTPKKGPRKFRNLRPQRKKIELALQQEPKKEEPVNLSDKTNSTDSNPGLSRENRSGSNRSSSPKRRAPDAPVGKPRENDSKVNLAITVQRLSGINRELREAKEEIG